MTCEGCKITLLEAVNIFHRNKSVEFLKKHEIIKQEIVCTTCNSLAVLNVERMMWRCQKRRVIRTGKKIIRERCSFKQSALTDTWFANIHMPIEKCCNMIAMYLLTNPPHQDFLKDEFKIHDHTACDWSSFVREVLEQWALQESATLIGGPGKVVEIDEAKFGKRKYNRGRIIDGIWIFGGFERDTREIFIEAVPDRSATTLLAVIKKRIRPGTLIISDCWKSYNCLKDEGYQHATVNHTYNFVDPDSGASTQHIERLWRDARSYIPRFGRREEYMSAYIAEFMFRRRYNNHTERLHAFYQAMLSYQNDIIKVDKE